MCIALLTTSHPKYPFILASNRDEFISRPTAPADWWDPPNSHVLGGRDLERDVRGTWLGITKQGRIACLTNFRESDTQRPISGLKSRGAICNSFLTTAPDSSESTAESAKRIVEDDGVNDVGGFSLLFGQLRRPDAEGNRDGLAIISNRTPDIDGVTWIAEQTGEVHGLSNSYFGDMSWPKVIHGEQMLKQSTFVHARKDGATKDQLIERLFELLSIDTLPKRKDDEDWDTFVLQLRNSIFIPRVGGQVKDLKSDEIRAADTGHGINTDESAQDDTGVYATQKQTVILVDQDGHVTFTEKTLHTRDGNSNNGRENIRTFEFHIEGW